MAIAQVSDVESRWGQSADTVQTSLIEARLADVERKIRRRIPDLDDKIADDPVFEADVIQVEADAVLRLVRNPEGFISETDGGYTYMLSQDGASGRLEIRPEEWRQLGVRKRRLVTLVPTFAPVTSAESEVGL